MLPERCQLALKEWAVTVDALARGEQILLLRKGGIHEASRDFRVLHREFLLYPTYEHQRADLLKPARQPALAQSLAARPPAESVTFSHWARAEEIIEVAEPERVADLTPHHIWTDAYAQARLHWKPNLPLAVLLLRVYGLERPTAVPYLKEYGGCTSWVDILPRIDLGTLTPALTDGEFARQAAAVKGSLGLAAG